MFTDSRSKRIILVAHCVLNQNSVSDGTADYPGAVNEIIEFLLKSNVGIIQMPCPEMLCLGLNRRNIHGAEEPVVVENSRIRNSLSKSPSIKILRNLVNQLVFQIEEYHKHQFSVLGIVGVDRSPTCGVNTTSKNNMEVAGEGVFIELLHEKLEQRHIHVRMIGIKSSEKERMLAEVHRLFHGD